MRAGFGHLSINSEGNFGKNRGNTRGSIGISPAAKNSNATLYNGRIDNTKCLGWWVDVGLKLGVATPHLICMDQ